MPAVSPSRPQEDLAIARAYPENPYQLNELAWELVRLPGREMSDYQKALFFSEEACQLEPKNGNILNTLGVAHHRLGDYEKAIDALSRSDKINSLRDNGSHPLDIAFLAMTHQQLGHPKEPSWRRAAPNPMKTSFSACMIAAVGPYFQNKLKASGAKRKRCRPNPSRPSAKKGPGGPSNGSGASEWDQFMPPQSIERL